MAKRQATHDKLWCRLREGGFILLSGLAIFMMIALISYSESDSAWSQTSTEGGILNAGGRMGALLADLLLVLFGYVSYLFPMIIAYGGVTLFRNRHESLVFNRLLWIFRVAGFMAASTAASGLMSLHFGTVLKTTAFSIGGILGQAVVGELNPAFGYGGTTLILLALFLAGTTLTTGLSWFGMMDAIKGFIVDFPILLREAGQKIQALLKRNKERKAIEALKPKRVTPRVHSSGGSPERKIEIAYKPKIRPEFNLPVHSAAAHNTLPPVDLLEPSHPDEHPEPFSNSKLEALSKEVESKLLEFGIEVSVVAVYPGPVITRFELELAPGLKVSKITALAKDLARALSVTRVRVVEVIPGKSVVGLEIPNEQCELVRLREIIESLAYQEFDSPLSLALGKDIGGESVVVNLSKMPHLLVAGTTGSGKSVGLNAMLLSLLYKATPEEVRLILIDPKMLELSIYDGIPHLLTPVVTDMKDAATALRWCVAEMERRYQVMAALGVRNLIGFNRKVSEAENQNKPLLHPLWQPEMGGEQPLLTKFPYIVVIIDEFADMMMVVGKKVEELIARIAQKARAAGIHMILATQRPSVDVITGLIKANVPTRIAFQVSSRIDSRTILDQQGAEQLLGHGDMLYLPPGSGVPVRIHGAFVSDEEVHRVVKLLKGLGEPDYAEDILGGGSAHNGVQGAASFGGGYDGFEDGEQDDLYDEAVQIVTETKKASISHLQRRLKIGYNRAARLIETMELAGIVSNMQSNGGREVLVGVESDD